MVAPWTDTPNIAVFADFENVALGARDAKFKRFDMDLVLQRLLERGNIVVRKAYCDWARYKADRKSLHERSFELVEVPHIKISGKNSADIRMCVDALDLAHTKQHVEIFALITGDSDFSPLVSKLRENNKRVVGIGVRQSTSDLLVDNCDEFIYYDDLVRESKPSPGRRGRSRKKSSKAGAKAEDLGLAAIELVTDTAERLFRDRPDSLWGSMVKQTLKRKQPNFSESYHGYRNFNELLEDARERGYLVLEKDQRSGGYLIVELGPEA